MTDDNLVIAISLKLSNDILDSILKGNRSDLDVQFLITMAKSYKIYLNEILGKPKNDHERMTNSIFSIILENIEKERKLPVQFGERIVNELIDLLAKHFKVKVVETMNKPEYKKLL